MKKSLLFFAGLLAVSLSSSIYSYRIRLYNDSDKITVKAEIYQNSDKPLTVNLSPYGQKGYYEDFDAKSPIFFSSVKFTAYNLAGNEIGEHEWLQEGKTKAGNIRFEIFYKDGIFSVEKIEDFDKSTAY